MVPYLGGVGVPLLPVGCAQDPDATDAQDVALMLRVIRELHAVVGRALGGVEVRSGYEAWAEFTDVMACEGQGPPLTPASLPACEPDNPDRFSLA